MSFHCVAYTINQAAGTDGDATAATDSELTTRNSHYLLTERYRMLAAYVGGATITRANVQVPLWNQITRFNLWPINRSANIPSPPQLDWWILKPPPLPQNEEITVKITNTGAAEQDTVFLWLAPDNWNVNLPAGRDPLPVFEARLTSTTPSLTANAWSGLSTPVFEQSLRSGTYAIVGAMFQATNLMMARFVFPRAPVYRNRKLRPGVLAQNAIGDLELQVLPEAHFIWGEYGRFSTVELPQIEYWTNTAGVATVEARWWMVWINESTDVQYAA